MFAVAQRLVPQSDVFLRQVVRRKIEFILLIYTVKSANNTFINNRGFVFVRISSASSCNLIYGITSFECFCTPVHMFCSVFFLRCSPIIAFQFSSPVINYISLACRP
jgi:hypothetical protein